MSLTPEDVLNKTFGTTQPGSTGDLRVLSVPG